MVRNSVSVSLLLLAFISTLSGAQDFGSTQTYNALVFADFTASSSDVEGRLAAGGNISLQNYSIGQQLNTSPPDGVLVAGGDVEFPSGKVNFGNILAGGSTSDVGDAVRYGMAEGASIVSGADLPIDFLQAQSELIDLSETLASLEPNANVVFQWGGLYMTAACDLDVQVFQLDGDQVLQAHTFSVDRSCAPAGATYIFNINGGSTGMTNMGMQSLEDVRDHVVYNFYQATSLTFQSISIEGSVLAPLADINNPSGVIKGHLFAHSWNGPMQINHVPFAGDLGAQGTPPSVNQAPLVHSQNLTVNEDSLIAVNLVASDADNDPLSYRIVTQPTHGTLSGTVPNLVYQVNPDYNGSDSFNFVANDGSLDSEIATIIVDIVSVNDAPVMNNQSLSTDEDTALAITLLATDIENDALSFVVLQQPVNGVLSGTMTNLSYQPNAEFNGFDTFTVKANDGVADSNIATYFIAVNGVNDAPVVADQSVLTDEDTAVNLVLTGSDKDNDSLSFSVVTQPAHGLLTGTAPNLVYQPNADYNGSDSFTFNANDGTADSDMAMVNIQVNAINDIPTAISQLLTTAEDTSINLSLIGSDVDGDSLISQVQTEPGHGQLSGVAPDLLYTPDANFYGSDSFSFIVNDGVNNSTASQVNILITAVNDAPIITSSPLISAGEGLPYSYHIQAADPDEDNLEYSLVTFPAGMTIDSVTGFVNWTPGSDQVGVNFVTVLVSDSNSLSVEQSFSILVEKTNHAPTITSTPILTVYANTNYQYLIQGNDADGDDIAYSLNISPDGMAIDSATQALKWSPIDSDVGAHEVEILVSDSKGGTSIQSFQLEVLPNDVSNTSPVIISNPVTLTKVGNLYNYSIKSLDIDNDVIQYSLENSPQGMSIDAVTGEVTWQPIVDQLGQQSVTVIAYDGKSIPGKQSFIVTVVSDIEIPNHEASDFWLMFNELGLQHQMLMIASQKDTSGLIEYGTTTKSFTVEANKVTQVELATGSSYDYSTTHSYSDGIQNKGIHVTADDKVTVYALSSSQSDGDAMPVLPTHALGTDYMVMTYENSNVRFSFVATEDATTVNVQLSTKTEAQSGMPIRNGDIVDGKFKLVLNKGETYKLQIYGNDGRDFTGTKIKADKPIAVFGGSACVFVPNEYKACDRLLSQMVPLELWGDTYVSAPLYSRYGGDTFRILASVDNSLIKINGEIITTLNEGEFHEIMIDEPAVITSNHPISVAQFSNGNNYDDIKRHSDPHYRYSSEYGNAELTGDIHLITIDENSVNNGVFVAIDAANIDSLTLDGKPVDTSYFHSAVVGGASRQIAQIALSNGDHVLKANEPFTAWEDTYGLEYMADPFMAMLPTTQQYLKDHLFTAPSSIFSRNFINVTAPVSVINNVVLDGVKIESYNFEPISGSGYAVARISVNVGSHHISAPEPIGILVYGYDEYYSYGYRGGLGVQSLKPVTNLTISASSTNPKLDEKVCLGIHAYDEFGGPVVRAPVSIRVSGTNDNTSKQFTTLKGDASYCYYGYLEGLDTIDVSSGDNTQTTNVTWSAADNSINHAPVITSIPNNLVQDGHDFIYQINAIDLNGDSLTYSITSPLPPGMTINSQTGLVLWPNAQAIINSKHVDIHLQIEVSDGLETATQNFTLWVNLPPVIGNTTYNPKRTALESKPNYVSYVNFLDPESDPVTTSLVSGPTGMVVHGNGQIVWDWKSLGDIALVNPVTVRATDKRGGTADYSFSITINKPPVITSTPPDSGVVGEIYSYQINATDVNGNSLSLGIISGPQGMTTVNTTGLIQWVPTAAGVFDVTTYASDGYVVTKQSWSITVTEPPVDNQPPTITSTPSNNAVVGRSYTYQVIASDPENDTLTYSVVSDLALGIGTDGLINWIPLPADIGSHSVDVTVTDTSGNMFTQTYPLNIAENTAPIFLSVPLDQSMYALDDFSYPVSASDSEGDAISFSILQGPLGLGIDSNGLITWQPQENQIGIHNITLTVDDGELQTNTNFAIEVRDRPKTLITQIDITPEIVDEGETVQIQVTAVNSHGITNATLKVDGQVVNLDNTNTVSILATGIGLHQVEATIIDQYETVSQTAVFAVRDASDITPPVVQISQPVTESTITAPTNIFATVTDDNLTSWRLFYFKTTGSATDTTILAEGSANVTDQLLATFDPTMLMNGQYTIYLEATDLNGQSSFDAVRVSVEGNLKVGNFSITEEDINIPLSGIPITIHRTYDSRNRSSKLDFGYGWSVDYQDLSLQESSQPTQGWNQISTVLTFEINGSLTTLPGSCTFPQGERLVTITLPNGDVEKFVAIAKAVGGGAESVSDPHCTLLASRYFDIQFIAKDGTDSQLVSLDGQNLYLTNVNGGNLVKDIIDTDAFDTQSYQLTTRTGYVYILDQYFGIKKVMDPNGNSLTYSANGITHSSGKSITFHRDSQGRIERITDPAGHDYVYHYDAHGDLQYVENPALLETPSFDHWEYVYDNHFLTEIHDPMMRRVLKNHFDASGRLYAQEDINGVIREFHHDIAARTSQVVDLDGRSTSYSYDDKGNILSETKVITDGSYAVDIVTSYTYDANGNQTTKTIGASSWTDKYDADDNQLWAEDPEKNRVDYLEYNARGQERLIQDELGRVTEMVYDAAGNLTDILMPEVTDPDTGVTVQHSASNELSSGYLISTTDLRGITTTYTYYPSTSPWFGLKHTESSPVSGTITYTYDDNNNVKTETRERTVDGVVTEESVEYFYDAANRRTRTVYPDTTYTETLYDPVGNIDQERDRFGVWTDYTYDGYGRLTDTYYANGSSEHRTYTREGLLETVTDRMGRTTTYEYDDAGRQWKVHYPDSSYTETKYTPQGWVQYEWDEKRNLTEYEYDLAGKRKAVIRYLNGAPIRHDFGYYANGELEWETDALLHTTNYVLNELDQRIETQYHDSTTTKQRYDAMGARIRSIDQRGIATDYRYDDLGRLWQVQPDVEINLQRVPNTEYSYDESGNKLTQTDANGHTTYWTYDYHGRVLSRKLPEGMTETFVYDDSLHTETHTDFNGQVTTTTYDDMGRVERIDFTNDPAIVYTYWENDQVKTVTDANGVTEYFYDARDRLDYLIQPDGTRLDYAYDDAGNRTEVKIIRGSETTLTSYGYDTLNRLETVTDANGTTSYTYDDVGNLDTVTYPNGNMADYDYTDVNQLDLLTITDINGNILESYDYGLDQTGRRRSLTEADGRYSEYSYDDLYRLTSETITDAVNGNYSASYEYDWVGNRSYSTIDGVQTSYLYDTNDRLKSQGGTSYSYDANGNLKSETLDGNIRSYVYDDRNKLNTLLDNSIEIASYSYNHNGIRIGSTEGATSTSFVVDENRDYAQVLQELESGTTTVDYSYGLDLISQSRGAETRFYQYDGLGSTRQLSDSTGTITDSYDYEAFGEGLNQTGTTENDYRFTGEQYDQGLGQYYLRARYYDPHTARFTQMDSWMGNNSDPQSLHKYLYAETDPVNNIDPTGKFSLGEGIGVIRTIGILARTSAGRSFLFQAARSSATSRAGLLVLAGMAGVAGAKISGLLDTKTEEDNDGPDEIYFHGTTANAASKIRKNGFRDIPTFFAEDPFTASHFAYAKAAENGARSTRVLKLIVPKAIRIASGMHRAPIGEDLGLRSVDIPGSTGFEWVISNSLGLQVINGAILTGKAKLQ